MVKYTLTYLGIRGRGETNRMILAASGLDWEDKRLTFEELKDTVKDKSIKTVPFMEFDGNLLGQSGAISRYVAREAGFYGNSQLENFQVDVIFDTITDTREKAIKVAFAPEDQKEEKAKEFMTDYMPKVMGNLEKAVQENQKKSGFFVGNSMTIADIHFYSTVDSFNIVFPEGHFLDNFPGLKKLYEQVDANSRIREYIDQRPTTDI